MTIAELRALPDGPSNARLEPSFVTYVRQASGTTYFLQDDPTGPAIALFKGAAEAPLEVAVGNRIELQVTSLTTFGGNKQISGETLLDNDNNTFDINNLVQLLTVEPDEELESELVRVVGATVVEVTPPNIFQIRLASNANVEMFAPAGGAVGLCAGATFDALCVISEFSNATETKYTLQCLNSADFTTVTTTGC